MLAKIYFSGEAGSKAEGGGQAEIHAETVRDGRADEIAALDVDDRLVARQDVSFEQYEEVHDVHNHEEETDLEEFTPPGNEFVFDGWGEMGKRQYVW